MIATKCCFQFQLDNVFDNVQKFKKPSGFSGINNKNLHKYCPTSIETNGSTKFILDAKVQNNMLKYMAVQVFNMGLKSK